MARRRRRKRRQRIFIKLFILILILGAVVAGIFVYRDMNKKRIKSEVVIEAGSVLVDVDEFLLSPEDRGVYLSAPSQEDLNIPRSYPVEIEVDSLISKKKYNSIIKVVDTTPPKAKLKDLEITMPNVVEASDFIESISDVSEYSVSFKSQPDFTKEGKQEVIIYISDEHKNSVELRANLTIIKDTNPPVIEGLEDKVVFVGDSISYRQGVVVTDDIDSEVELTIDNSKVNLKQPGEYTAVYIATDSSGNTTKEEIKVIVRAKTDNPVDEEEVFAIADQVLSEIINPSMSMLDKAWSIYSWVVRNLSYVNASDKTDWINGAYEGFITKKGDCFTYFSVTKTLLTRADIPNLDVRRVGGSTNHYWHLVDCGQGWYHLDTTPQRDYLQVFMLTDEEVEAYTARAGRNYYTYDKSLYPERGK
jgi:hypothetical protein